MAVRRSERGRGTNKALKKTLEYACTCADGNEPGSLQDYDSSLFSKVCQEAFKQCSETNAGDPVELPKCEDIQARCGTKSISDMPEGGADAGSGDDEKEGEEDSSDGGDEDKEGEDG
ncbi:hypothetical protein IMZ48_16555, partial [Candidatus Bathyarchaeota archaeon]|nr:hypothetical protein [Candidatus Bathyarchaeota archaeon]